MLEQVVWDAIVEHHLDRSLVLTPDALAPFPTTDGGLFHLAGVPLVNYLAAPWYLFDPADTMDKVDRATLSKVSRCARHRAIDGQGVSQADARLAPGTRSSLSRRYGTPACTRRPYHCPDRRRVMRIRSRSRTERRYWCPPNASPSPIGRWACLAASLACGRRDLGGPAIAPSYALLRGSSTVAARSASRTAKAIPTPPGIARWHGHRGCPSSCGARA